MTRLQPGLQAGVQALALGSCYRNEWGWPRAQGASETAGGGEGAAGAPEDQAGGEGGEGGEAARAHAAADPSPSASPGGAPPGPEFKLGCSRCRYSANGCKTCRGRAGRQAGAQADPRVGGASPTCSAAVPAARTASAASSLAVRTNPNRSSRSKLSKRAAARCERDRDLLLISAMFTYGGGHARQAGRGASGIALSVTFRYFAWSVGEVD